METTTTTAIAKPSSFRSIVYIDGRKYYSAQMWTKIFNTDYSELLPQRIKVKTMHILFGMNGIAKKHRGNLSYYPVDAVSALRIHTENFLDELVRLAEYQ